MPNKTAADILGDDYHHAADLILDHDTWRAIDVLAAAGYLKRPDEIAVRPEAQAVLDAADTWLGKAVPDLLGSTRAVALGDAVVAYRATLAPKPTTCRADELKPGDVFLDFGRHYEVLLPLEGDGIFATRSVETKKRSVWSGTPGSTVVTLVSRAKDGDCD